MHRMNLARHMGGWLSCHAANSGTRYKILNAQVIVALVPLALRGLWGSFFSRSHDGKAMRRFRGLWLRIALVAGPALAPADATPERLQERVLALRGDRR